MILNIFLSFTISFVSLLLIIHLSHKHQFFLDDADHDKPQNFHQDHTPRAGGIGVLLGMLFILLFPLGIKFSLPIFLAFLSGIFEDFHNSLSPKFRLLLQFIAALSAVYFTNSIVTYLGLGIELPYWIGFIFSIFAIMGMMNAINIIDGFNGLASGVIVFILSSFAYVSYPLFDTDIFSIILIVLAATLGFFILNFPKGKIFLGDGGAYMLGFIVAIIGIYLASQNQNISPWYIMALFIYPVWEVVFSILRRKALGLSSLEADALHLHTLIYKKITHSNPKTTLSILIALLPFIVIPTLYAYSSILNIIMTILFTLVYITLYIYLYKKPSS